MNYAKKFRNNFIYIDFNFFLAINIFWYKMLEIFIKESICDVY